MANKDLIPDLEKNPVRNICVIGLNGRLRPGNILQAVTERRRGSWAVVVTDKPQLVRNYVHLCADLPAVCRKTGAEQVQPRLTKIIVEVTNYDEIKKIRQAVHATQYKGELVFIAEQRLRPQFSPNIRQQVTFVGKEPTKALAQMIA